MRCFAVLVFIIFCFCLNITYAKGLFEYERIDFFNKGGLHNETKQTASNDTPEIVIDEWAEPIVSSSGRISIYLPPKEVRSFLDNPDPKNAKAYLEWNSRRIKKFLAAQEALKKETKEIETMNELKSQPSLTAENKTKANYLFYFMRKECLYCAKETPVIEDIYLNHPEIKIKAFARGYSDQELSRFKFPVMQDNGMSRILKLTSYPFIVISNKKQERYRLPGFIEKEKILELFE